MARPAATVLVSDCHLGQAPEAITEDFHRFLAAVPDLGDHLLINGDLFEFWFEYRHVIPRACFHTLAALRQVRQSGVRLTVMGGNHDRWGASFWREEMDAAFYRRPIELQLGRWTAWVAHGDGLAEIDRTSKLLHMILRNTLTIKIFRWIHPDLSFELVKRLSKNLAARHGDELTARSARSQAEYVSRLLQERRHIDLVLVGHTHVPVSTQVEPGRWYVNPGAWYDGLRYAVITDEGPDLRQFS